MGALMIASVLAACSSGDESTSESSSVEPTEAPAVAPSTSCPPAIPESDEPDIDFVLYFELDADPVAVQQLVADIEDRPDVASTRYFDQQEAYEEFAQLFADSPELVDTVSPEILPTSLRVRTADLDATEIEALADTLGDEPVVRDVLDDPGDPSWPDRVPEMTADDC